MGFTYKLLLCWSGKTESLSLSLSLCLARSLPLSRSLCVSLFLTHSHTHTHSYSLIFVVARAFAYCPKCMYVRVYIQFFSSLISLLFLLFPFYLLFARWIEFWRHTCTTTVSMDVSTHRFVCAPLNYLLALLNSVWFSSLFSVWSHSLQHFFFFFFSILFFSHLFALLVQFARK